MFETLRCCNKCIVLKLFCEKSICFSVWSVSFFAKVAMSSIICYLFRYKSLCHRFLIKNSFILYTMTSLRGFPLVSYNIDRLKLSIVSWQNLMLFLLTNLRKSCTEGSGTFLIQKCPEKRHMSDICA